MIWTLRLFALIIADTSSFLQSAPGEVSLIGTHAKRIDAA
jgi:hypothetical protein